MNKLQAYVPTDKRDERVRDEIAEFVHEHSDCFERSLTIGHITGSAWIVNRRRDRFLLTFHKKLGLWLQLGGHADGNSDILAVAMQEACEESGIEIITPISDDIFDLDIHRIPEHKGVAEHYHYDVRFFCEADHSEKLIVSDESHDLAWLSVAEIKGLTNEESILRMLRRGLPA